MNKHLGSSFDDFLKEEGLLEEVSAAALERAHLFLTVEEQQRQVKEQLKHHIDNMLITDVDYGELNEDDTPVVLTIKGQPTS